MTVTDEQNAMLERLCEKWGYGFWTDPETGGFTDNRNLAGEGWQFEADEHIMKMLRELLQAVQERDQTVKIAAIIEEHETNYHQSPTGGWIWTCRCQAGTPLFLAHDTREECVQQTRLHWQGAIREAIRAQTYADLFQEEK